MLAKVGYLFEKHRCLFTHDSYAVHTFRHIRLRLAEAEKNNQESAMNAKRCLERGMNDKLSLNCSGTEWQEGRGERDKARRVGWGGLQKGRGHLIVNDGQKGRRVWKIPEQSGWYGGGGARGSARVITREDNGLVSLQARDWSSIRMTYL